MLIELYEIWLAFTSLFCVMIWEYKSHKTLKRIKSIISFDWVSMRLLWKKDFYGNLKMNYAARTRIIYQTQDSDAMNASEMKQWNWCDL